MYIGIDVGGTNIKYGTINDDGQIVSRYSCPTPHQRETFLQTLQCIIVELLDDSIQAIGISIPGIVQSGAYLKAAGSLSDLYELDLKAEIQQYCNVPIWIENDANCAAIAEKWVGNATDVSNYVCVTVGTGIGGGIIIHDEIYRGSQGWAGEFGWMVSEHISDRGDIEHLSHNFTGAVGLGLHRNYIEKTAHTRGDKAISAKEILASEETDAIASEVVKTFYQSLAKLIINSISILNPQVVLIGGAISENTVFINRLLKEVETLIGRHRSLLSVTQATDGLIRPCKLGNNAGMIGAAYLARKILANKESK